jgi:hypothetical protein
MGLNKSQNSNNAVYFFNGRVNMPSLKTETTIEKNGKHYEQFESISGRISHIQVVKGYQENTKDLLLTLTDIDDSYLIRFGLNSSYFRSFSRMFPNLNLTDSLEIFPTMKMDGDKEKNGLVIKQKDVWIKRFYTQENIGEMPIAIPVEVNGNTQYDYKNQNDFLISMIEKKFASEKLPF